MILLVLIIPLLYTGKIQGGFKIELIKLPIKDYVRKLESGRIQDSANQSQIVSIGRK